VHSVKRLAVWLPCVFLLLASCRGKTGRNVESLILRSITVSPPSATVAVGQTQQFTAAANFSHGSSRPLLDAAWSTSAPTVTNVTSTGLVTTVGQGHFAVFATLEKITGSATLTVELRNEPTTQELASRCPAPSKEIQATCRGITYEDLPDGARALLHQLRCDTGPSSNYNYGTAVDLNGDGIPEYQLCCNEAPHGPCGAVLIVRIGGKWTDLTPKNGMLGFEGPCNQFVVLATQHGGFHDVCLRVECAPSSKAGTCNPTIWQFDGTRYQVVDTAATLAPPK
jgi:Bacterial Ig-like domain (group 2)